MRILPVLRVDDLRNVFDDPVITSLGGVGSLVLLVNLADFLLLLILLAVLVRDLEDVSKSVRHALLLIEVLTRFSPLFILFNVNLL